MFVRHVSKAAQSLASLALCATLFSCSASVNGGDPLNIPFPKQVTPEKGQLKISKDGGFEDFNDIQSDAGFTKDISHDLPFKVTEETTLQPQLFSMPKTEHSAACDQFVGDVKFSVTDKATGISAVIPTTTAGYGTFTAEPGKDYVLNVFIANPTGCRIELVTFLMKAVAKVNP